MFKDVCFKFTNPNFQFYPWVSPAIPHSDSCFFTVWLQRWPIYYENNFAAHPVFPYVNYYVLHCAGLYALSWAVTILLMQSCPRHSIVCQHSKCCYCWLGMNHGWEGSWKAECSLGGGVFGCSAICTNSLTFR